jgi:hypothetical protein
MPIPRIEPGSCTNQDRTIRDHFPAASGYWYYQGLFQMNKNKKTLRGPYDRAEVAFPVDTVQCQDGFIIQVVFPDPDPAQLVTDSSEFRFSAYHGDNGYLAGDPIKGCMEKPRIYLKNPDAGFFSFPARKQKYRKKNAGTG